MPAKAKRERRDVYEGRLFKDALGRYEQEDMVK